MTTYEYKTFHVNMVGDIQKHLAKQAKKGWRLRCTTTAPGFHGVWVHLEREVPDDRPIYLP